MAGKVLTYKYKCVLRINNLPVHAVPNELPGALIVAVNRKELMSEIVRCFVGGCGYRIG
jgi:hypothetical protein